MLYSLPSAAGYRLAGLKTLLLAPWSGASYVYASADRSHITGFSGLTGWQYVSCEAGAACEFGEVAAQTKNGKTYSQAVSVAVAGLTPGSRSAVEALLDAGPVVALCQDFNNQWWLYGQTFGLRLLTATGKGGVLAAETTQVLPLTGTQREAARTVAKARVALLYNSSTVFTLPA